MNLMEKVFSVTLQNGKVTNVYFSQDIKDLSHQLGTYGNNALWVFDTNTAPLFRNLPLNRVVLESGEKNKNWKSIVLYIIRVIELVLTGAAGGAVSNLL